MDPPKPNRQLNPLHSRKGEEISLDEMQALDLAAAATVTAAQLMPSLFFAKEIGEISGKANGLSEENNRLREKLNRLKKENDALKKKVDAMESQNNKHGETIRCLESSRDKLQKELEKVKTAKDRLRIEVEEKTSKLSAENTILTEKLENLTKEFEVVESENKELQRRLEELTNTCNSLKKNVDSLREENQELKEEHKKIREKLECKETRLALGQIAWLLEKEIWKAVLPDQKMGYTGILKSMERWLERNSSTSDGKAAQKRWDDLKEKLKWNEKDHKYALKHLKELRREDAHPDDVNLEVARKQLNEGEYIADTDKETCEQIIDMVLTARILNNSK